MKFNENNEITNCQELYLCRHIASFSGKGRLILKSRILYEGDFEDNLPNGFGVFARDTSSRWKIFTRSYRGETKNGEKKNMGTLHHRDGSYYVGMWEHGKQENYGLRWYTDGSFYAGHFSKGVCHGSGMFVRTDGNRYEGEWKDGMKHGKGIFFHLDKGQMQEGVWVKDMCIFSTIKIIPFRQRAMFPTKYPITEVSPELWLLRTQNFVLNVLQTYVADWMFKEHEAKVLKGQTKSCLSLNMPPTVITNPINTDEEDKIEKITYYSNLTQSRSVFVHPFNRISNNKIYYENKP